MVRCSPSTDKPPAEAGSSPPDLHVCPFTVAYDTREQAPWTFGNVVLGGKLWVVRRQLTTMATGDYAIADMDRVCIERKSASDFYGSVVGGAPRFKREHERMAEMVAGGCFACVVVEGSLSDVCMERPGKANGVLGACAAWPARYGVHWFFAGDRRTAEILAFRIMLKQWEEGGCSDSK